MALIALAIGVTVLAHSLLRARRNRADLVLAGVVMLGLGGVMLKPEASVTKAPAQTFTLPSGQAELTDLEFTWEDGQRYLVGTLRNPGDRTLGIVILDISLLDEDGVELGRVGASYTRFQNVQAGEERPFRAWIPFEEAREARVRGVQAH